jgi:hypothetical protein
MKFLSINTYPVEKMADIAKVTDKLASNPPEDYKILAIYGCLANPFPGVELPPGTMVSISVLESNNAASMATAALEMTLAGANVNRIPILEVPTGEVEGTVDKLKV